MKYLLWDVDGTLLLTGGAGKDALVKVIMDYYFLDAFPFTESLAGRTDADIIKNIVTRLRGRCNVGEAASLLIRYHMQLPKELPTHSGRVLKNVEKTLQHFAKPDSKYKNCLLTGNTRTGAFLKLQYYKLDQYFDFNHSAFGEISESRDELARTLFSRLYLADQNNFTAQDLIVIGDTVKDAQCAHAIGARCLIVLDGTKQTREDFAEVQPWKILDYLPDNPEELEKLFDEA